MGLMDTRYPAYEVRTGRGGARNILRRLELDRKKGVLVRQESQFGLFGEVVKTIRVKDYRFLKKGECSSSGICAESDMYVCLTGDDDRETVFRFTMPGHVRVMEKYLAGYVKRNYGSGE